MKLLCLTFLSVLTFVSSAPAETGVYSRKYYSDVYLTTIKYKTPVHGWPYANSPVLGEIPSGTEIVVKGVSFYTGKDILSGGNVSHSESLSLMDSSGRNPAVADTGSRAGDIWLLIDYAKNKDKIIRNLGWIRKQHANNFFFTISNTMRFVSFERLRSHEGKNTPASRGTLSFTIDGKIYKVTATRNGQADFYTFTWNEEMKDFSFTHVPGSYAWFPETNEICHITYRGHGMESAWVMFADGFLYMLQDFGTAPGIRYISVFDRSREERIFAGTYYKDISLRGCTIDIAYEYTDVNIKNGRLDSETIDYAEDYLENHILTPRDDGLFNRVLITYNYNFITGERKYTGCRVIGVQ